jgi:cytochrome c-type biogenesis protein CcsB
MGKFKLTLLDAAALGLVAFGIARMVWQHKPEEPASDFARQVDVTPLQGLALQTEGRIKAFDSFARELMRNVSGRRLVDGQPAAFTYLDQMLRPEHYETIDTIYVKNKLVRQRIAAALGDAAPAGWPTRFLSQGLIARRTLQQPRILAVLRELQGDVMRTSKDIDQISSALAISNAGYLLDRLTVVPAPSGLRSDRWYALSELVGSAAPSDDALTGVTPGAAFRGLDDARRNQLVTQWTTFADAWRSQNAAEASTALAAFADGLRALAPAWYPTHRDMALENWYFRNEGMTWVWLIYLGAVIPLLMSVVYRWGWARVAGLALFGLAFACHTASLAIRWKVAERWPNSNMFEAVHTAAWFGVLAALGLEVWVRKTPMRNLFALGSAVCAMAALMAGRYTDAITPEINNFMPILDDIWLYIHTNMIIWSYALIGMAGITGLVYLRYRLGGGNREVTKSGGAGTLLLAGTRGGMFLREDPATFGQVLDGATMILMELSFVMLWAGIVMGAIWADHSWGRPWGWDPKEVFALNTFLVFLLLVHVRYKVRDKGLWTAILAVVGCGVMLFNWIVINFYISGLHSYA